MRTIKRKVKSRVGEAGLSVRGAPWRGAPGSQTRRTRRTTGIVSQAEMQRLGHRRALACSGAEKLLQTEEQITIGDECREGARARLGRTLKALTRARTLI